MALKMKAVSILAAIALMTGMLPTAALAAEVSDTTDSEDSVSVTITEAEDEMRDLPGVYRSP